MPIELRNSDRLPAPQGFSHAAIASPGGRIVHLSGQIGTDADGNHPDGLAAQTDQAMRNIIDALLGIGGSCDDLAKLTIYVVGWTAAMQGALFTGLAKAIQSKRVTYDFERLMDGATLLKCSEFGDEVIKNMG